MCTAVESRAVATIPWVAVVRAATGRPIVAMKPLTVVRTVDFRTAVARTVVVHTLVAAESSVVVAANNSGYWFVAGTLLKHMWVDSWKGKGLAYCALKSCSA